MLKIAPVISTALMVLRIMVFSYGAARKTRGPGPSMRALPRRFLGGG
jgi:hypothetical protein